MTRGSLTLALVLAACSSSNPKPSGTGGIVLFGANFDETGNSADPGRVQAAQLGITDVNDGLKAAGAFQNDQFQLIVKDSVSTGSIAVTNAMAFLDAGVKASLIDVTPDTEAVAAYYYRTDGGWPTLDYPILAIVTTSPAVNNPAATLAQAGNDPFVLLGLQNADRWVWRDSSPATDGLSLVLMRLMQQQGSGGDVNGDGQVVISEFGTNDPGIGLGQFQALVATVPQLRNWGPHEDGGVNLDLTTFNYQTVPATADLSSTIVPALGPSPDGGPDAGPPDMLFLAGQIAYYPAMLQAYDNNQSTLPVFLATTITSDAALVNVGNLANGMGGATWVFTDNDTSGQTFDSEFKSTFNTNYGVSDSQAYDGVELLALATVYAAHANNHASLADVQGSEVRDALSMLSQDGGVQINAGSAGFTQGVNAIVAGTPINYSGASGNCDFDANGNVRDNVIRFEVQSGALQFFERYDCATDPTCPVDPSN